MDHLFRRIPGIQKIKSMGFELGMVGSGQLIAALGAIIGVRFLTNYLDAASYGEINLGMTLVTLANQLVYGPLSGAFLRYFSIAQEKKELETFYSVVLTLIFRTCLFSLLFGLLFTAAWGWIEGSSRILFLLFTVFYTALSGFNTYFDSIQNAARQRKVVAFHQAVGQWLRILLAVLVIFLLGATSTSAMLGYAVAAGIILFSQILFFKRKLNEDEISFLAVLRPKIVDKKWTTHLISFSLPFILWGIFTWAQSASDRWALNYYVDARAVGFYAVLYQLGYYPITFLTSIFVQFLSPILYQKAGDGTDQQRTQQAGNTTGKIVIGSFVLTVCASIVCFILSEFIFGVFTAPEYHSVHYYLPLMVFSGGIFSTAQILALIPLNNNQPQVLIAPKLATSIIGVILNILGAKFWGLQGIILSNITFSMLYFVWVRLITSFQPLNKSGPS